MRITWYAIIAACLVMLLTSGIVAFATAAPSHRTPRGEAAFDPDVRSHLDELITRQLAAARQRPTERRW